MGAPHDDERSAERYPPGMARSVVRFEDTPNPNALKCALDGPILRPGEQPKPYRTAESAAGDALASKLFAIPGVTNVLVGPDWITVNRVPGADWRGIKEGVRRALESAGG